MPTKAGGAEAAFTLVVLAVAVSACGSHLVLRTPTPPPTRDFASGSRLRARALQIDGALVLEDFFDLGRNEPCAFVDEQRAHVGPSPTGPVYYCLPRAMAVHDGTTGPFSDASCTKPVALVRGDGAAPYLVVRPANSCSAAPRVHRAGPLKFSFPYFLEDGVCRGSKSPIGVQAPEDEVPLDQFVRAEERIEDPPASASPPPATTGTATGARLASLVAVSADGSRTVVGAWDRARSEAVRPAIYATWARWIPARVAFEGASDPVYGDPTCTASLATKISRDALCPLSAAAVFSSTCSESVVYKKLGAEVGPDLLHARNEAGACVVAPGLGVQAFTVGDPIPLTDFAEVSFADIGGAQVRRRGYSAVGGAVVSWGELVDVPSKVSCAPTTANDGLERCLPVASALVDLFADPSCETPAFARAITGCEDPAPTFVRVDGEPGARVFAVTGEVPELFELRGETCAPHTPVVPSRRFAAAEVPVSRFATVREVEE